MKKIYIFTSLIILLLISVHIFNYMDKTFYINEIKYSVSVDGKVNDSFPDKGSYDVTVFCLNESGIWNYDDWTIDFYDIKENESCNISFTSKSAIYLNDYIKNTLTGTTQGNGQVVNENGYRYEGKNPNNYIMFNNELWRIIGVFDSSSHGQSEEYLTKIIRNDSIGGLVWDNSGIYGANNWATSSLYNLLNTYYYNAKDGTNSGYCNYFGSIMPGTCDYTVGGIQEEFRPMVKNVIWYLGGYESYYVTTNNIYIYERNNDDRYYYAGNRSNKTATGNIGLMYLSDFGYSALANSCSRTTTLYNYNTSTCAGNSWLIKHKDEWTITHNSAVYNGVFLVDNASFHEGYFSYLSYSTRPTLYLDSSVYIITGDGSITNPYIIGM